MEFGLTAEIEYETGTWPEHTGAYLYYERGLVTNIENKKEYIHTEATLFLYFSDDLRKECTSSRHPVFYCIKRSLGRCVSLGGTFGYKSNA